MNFEDLISKYIDGELNELEDVKLRQLISSDPLKKKEFDRAILLHYAIKDDARSITPPASLIGETHDKIMMKIIADQPVIQRQIKRKVAVRRAVALAAVLLFGFSIITDININKFGGFAQNSEQTKTETVEKTNGQNANGSSENRSFLAQRSEVTNAQRNVRYTKSISNNLNIGIAKEALGALKPREDNSDVLSELPASLSLSEINSNEEVNVDEVSDEVNSIAERSIYSFQDQLSRDYNSNNLNDATARFNTTISGSKSLMNQLMSLDNTPTDVVINTNVTNTFSTSLKNSEGKTPEPSLSQSIGYKFGEKHVIGLEFGNMNLYYDENVTISVPISSYTNGGVEGQNDVIIIPGGGESTQVPLQFTKDSKLFWGSMFYKYSFLDLSFLDLNASLGFGGSKYGMINYYRLNSSLELIDGIYLNLGIDGRLFMTNIPNSIDKGEKLQSALSFMYGIQFKF